MGKVADHLLSLIAKQVDDKGIVVWYDPERAYTNVWCNRVDYREAYIAGARAVENEAGLSGLELPTERMAGMETFPFLETALLLAL